jgi:hypothetical protein
LAAVCSRACAKPARRNGSCAAASRNLSCPFFYPDHCITYETVSNIKDATYTNAIGAPYLTAYWKDPAFDAKQRAFYYVRVLEIPTPRWTTFDAKVFGVKLPTDVPASIQDRAYTSPIWYTPER